MGIAPVASGVMSAVNIFNEQQGYSQQQDNLKANEQYARQQAEEAKAQAERIATSQEDKAIEDSKRSRLADKRRMEKMQAMMAGSGVSSTYGSPLQVAEIDDITSSLNTLDIFEAGFNQANETRYAGEQKRRGLLYEAEQYKYQRDLSKQMAKTKLITGLIKGTVGVAGAMKGTSAGGKSQGGLSSSTNLTGGTSWSAGKTGKSWTATPYGTSW